MSIDSVNGNPNAWYWQTQSAQAASGTTPSGPIANTGSVSASAMSAFFQSFSADLQAMLAQATGAASTAANTSATTGVTGSTTDPATQTAVNKPISMGHHHHHHTEGHESPDSTQGVVSQMVADIGQVLQGGSLTASGIGNSASLFASDVMQALQAYGSAATNASTTALLA